MKIDHIGIAVKDIEKSVIYWESAFGYMQMTEVVLNSTQKVLVTFLEKEDSITIKLIQPSDETSPLNNFIKKGGGLHHLCFKTDNLQEAVVELKEKGLRLLVEPQPGEAFDDNLIAFMFTKDNLNIEVIETEVKAKRKNKSL